MRGETMEKGGNLLLVLVLVSCLSLLTPLLFFLFFVLVLLCFLFLLGFWFIFVSPSLPLACLLDVATLALKHVTFGSQLFGKSICWPWFLPVPNPTNKKRKREHKNSRMKKSKNRFKVIEAKSKSMELLIANDWLNYAIMDRWFASQFCTTSDKLNYK